jgi:Ca-activated chloride channel family protein
MLYWTSSYWALLFIPLIAFLVYRIKIYKNQLVLKVTQIPVQNSQFPYWIVFIPEILQWISLVMLILALMRPQKILSYSQKVTEGIDIILVLDASKSMEETDFLPNRLEVAKNELLQFIDQRQGDRLGLVIFAEDAFSACPLTLDKDLLKSILQDVTTETLPSSGTAIGTALVTAVNRLQNVKDSKSKIILLVTDGVSNKGKINPITAAQLAAKKNIKIFAIGIGTKTDENTEYDFPTLQKIAQITQGQAYEAQNTEKLQLIFEKLQMEYKSIFQQPVKNKTKDVYPYFLWAFLALFLLSFGLKNVGIDQILTE